MSRVFAVLVLAAAAILPGVVSAQQPAPLTLASAHWTEDDKVELTVTWDGSACEQAEAPVVSASESDEAIDVVTIPTVASADMCTQQIVPVEYSGVIAVEPLTTTLAVIVLDFEGQPKVAGSVEIDRRAGTADPIGALSEVSARRTSEGEVDLRAVWDGSACEEPGVVQVEAGTDATDEVTIPTIATSEVCTREIVPVEFSGIIEVDPATTALDVTVLNTDGLPRFEGSVEIE